MKVYFLSKVDGSKSAINEVSPCNKETPSGFVKRTTMKFKENEKKRIEM